jgi:hypothetical protein
MRVTVWRYEDAEGQGPYASWRYWNGCVAMSGAHGDGSRPSWENDELHWCINSDYVAGCPSRELLMNWFDGFHRDLLAGGFQIVTYRIPHERVEVGYSRTQVAFLKGSVRGVIHERSLAL